MAHRDPRTNAWCHMSMLLVLAAALRRPAAVGRGHWPHSATTPWESRVPRQKVSYTQHTAAAPLSCGPRARARLSAQPCASGARPPASPTATARQGAPVLRTARQGASCRLCGTRHCTRTWRESSNHCWQSSAQRTRPFRCTRLCTQPRRSRRSATRESRRGPSCPWRTRQRRRYPPADCTRPGRGG